MFQIHNLSIEIFENTHKDKNANMIITVSANKAYNLMGEIFFNLTNFFVISRVCIY